jgi:hypothetical protein
MDVEHICYEIVGWILWPKTVVPYEHTNECTGLILDGAFLENLCNCKRLKGTLFDGVR